MFNPRSSPELEWVELCNTAAGRVDVAGYTLWDDDNVNSVAPNFPAGATVPGHECVVLTGADDVAEFQVAWGASVAVLGIVRFPTLTNSGDRVQLWDGDHPPSPEDVETGAQALISFAYVGSLGDGVGSIQLLTLTADPGAPESWALSLPGVGTQETVAGDLGSPGLAP